MDGSRWQAKNEKCYGPLRSVRRTRTLLRRCAQPRSPTWAQESLRSHRTAAGRAKLAV